MALQITGADYTRPPERLTVAAGGRHAAVGIRIGVMVLGAVLVTVLPPLLGVALVAGIVVALALLANPVVGLYALLFAVPFESVRNLQAGGINITITDLFSFCVAAAWIGRCASQQRIEEGGGPWLKPVLIYGIVIAVSITQATIFALSLKEMLKWGELLFAYLVGMSMIRTRQDLKRLLVVLFIAVILESAVGVAQAVLHAGPSSFARAGFLRASGTFDQPNPFAGYLNMCLPLAVALLGYRVFPRPAMWLVVLVAGGGVLTSLSRGGELAGLAALVTMAALALPKSRVLVGIAGIAVAAVIVGVMVGLVPSSVTDPLAQQLGVANIDVANPSPANWPVAERLAHMQAGLAMWADHPFLGVGIGNYAAVYDKYQVAPVWQFALGHAHNYYINIGAEAGVVGLLAFLLLIVSALVICVRAFRRSQRPLDRAVGLGAAGVVVGIAVHSFFDNIFVHGMEVQVALVMVAASRVYAGFDEDSALEQNG